MKIINKYNFALGIISAVFIFLLSGFAAYAQKEVSDYDSLIVIPKERVLRLRRIDNLIHRQGISQFHKIKENIYLIPIDKNEDSQTKLTRINQLEQTNLFDLVEPNFKLYPDEVVPERNYIKITNHSDEGIQITLNSESKEVTPNDKGFISQYYLREINVTKAWSTTIGDSLLVGILDTGVDSNHPDLLGKVIGGSSLNNTDLEDEIGHGTEVAGIIAANTNNYQGIAGISWNTKVLSLKVTDEVGQARVSTVVSALDEAYSKGVKIVQISLSTNQFSQTLKNAIKEAQDRGILIISTAGNTGVEELRYPAAFNGVIGVGAVDKNKERESYSTTGEHVSLVAPGSFIYTTSTNSGYREVSGTSFSAPQVAGAAALVWSVVPNLTNNQVREILIQSTDDVGDIGKDLEYGYGILNIQKAVELAKNHE